MGGLNLAFDPPALLAGVLVAATLALWWALRQLGYRMPGTIERRQL
jgi:hypothetical protein